MAITILPSFVGGAEPGPYFVRLLGASDAILDMTGYTYRAEAWWDQCAQISLEEGSGITRLVDLPASNLEWHYSFGFTEQQGKCVPIGVTPVKLFYISPAEVTVIDVVNLKRTL